MFCSDIDECEDDRLCANGHCVNTEGSFHCRCYEGYQRTQEGSHCEGEHSLHHHGCPCHVCSFKPETVPVGGRTSPVFSVSLSPHTHSLSLSLSPTLSPLLFGFRKIVIVLVQTCLWVS